MPRPAQDVTDTELSILELLWESGSSTVRKLAEQLYAKAESSTSNHATVQKLLERLEGKGCVRRDRATWPHTFEPAVAREELIGRQLQQTADKLCQGSLGPLLTHLVKARKLTAHDRQSLRSLLDELNHPKGRQSKE